MSEETILHLLALIEVNQEQNNAIINLSDYISHMEGQVHALLLLNVASWIVILSLILIRKWKQKL